jgi:hypothetical protein
MLTPSINFPCEFNPLRRQTPDFSFRNAPLRTATTELSIT